VLAHAQIQGLQVARRPFGAGETHSRPSRPSGWASEPDVGRVANGVAFRVDRLRACGNGVVPAVAARAWTELSGRF
jgi:DNA (cytosine-5)-methyltransferase 1